MNNFETYLQHICDALQDSKVKDAMQYSLMAGGKRIRPQILLAALQCYGIEAVSYTHLDVYKRQRCLARVGWQSL